MCEYAKPKMWKSGEEMAQEGMTIVNMTRKNRRTDCIKGKPATGPLSDRQDSMTAPQILESTQSGFSHGFLTTGYEAHESLPTLPKPLSPPKQNFPTSHEGSK